MKHLALILLALLVAGPSWAQINSKVYNVDPSSLTLTTHLAWPDGVGTPNTPPGFTSQGDHGTGTHCGAARGANTLYDTNCDVFLHFNEKHLAHTQRIRIGSIPPPAPLYTADPADGVGPCGYAQRNSEVDPDNEGEFWQHVADLTTPIDIPPVLDAYDESVCHTGVWSGHQDLHAVMYYDGIWSGGVGQTVSGNPSYGMYGWGPLAFVLENPAQAVHFKVVTTSDTLTPTSSGCGMFMAGCNKTLRIAVWLDDGDGVLDGVYTYDTSTKPDGTEPSNATLRHVGVSWSIALAAASGERILSWAIDSVDGAPVGIGANMDDTIIISTGTWDGSSNIGQEAIPAIRTAGIGGTHRPLIHCMGGRGVGSLSNVHCHQCSGCLNGPRRPDGLYDESGFMSTDPLDHFSCLEADLVGLAGFEIPDGHVTTEDVTHVTDCKVGYDSLGSIPVGCERADIPAPSAFTFTPQGDGVIDQADVDAVDACAALNGGAGWQCGVGGVVCGTYTGFNADADLDGIPDALDNCQYVANPNQCDSNKDGFGNVCDHDLSNSPSTGAVNAADISNMAGTGFSQVFGTTGPPCTIDADFDDNTANDLVNAFDDFNSMGTGFSQNLGGWMTDAGPPAGAENPGDCPGGPGCRSGRACAVLPAVPGGCGP